MVGGPRGLLSPSWTAVFPKKGPPEIPPPVPTERLGGFGVIPYSSSSLQKVPVDTYGGCVRITDQEAGRPIGPINIRRCTQWEKAQPNKATFMREG